MDSEKLRIIVLGEPCSLKMIDELNDVFKQVAESGLANAQGEGIVPKRTYTTKAFAKIENRYFKFVFTFIAIPTHIEDQDIIEVTKRQYHAGIDAEMKRDDNTTEWKDVETQL